MRTYSTRQAAKLAGISAVTLWRWVAAGKIKASGRIQYNGQRHWRWSERDVEKIRKLSKPKKKA